MSTTSLIPKYSAIAVTVNNDFVSGEISGCWPWFHPDDLFREHPPLWSACLLVHWQRFQVRLCSIITYFFVGISPEGERKRPILTSMHILSLFEIIKPSECWSLCSSPRCRDPPCLLEQTSASAFGSDKTCFGLILLIACMYDDLRDQHDTDYHNDNHVIKLSRNASMTDDEKRWLSHSPSRGLSLCEHRAPS